MNFELTPELEAKVTAAESLDEVVEILKAEGMDVTKEELEKAVAAEQSDELGEDDLEEVAGGLGPFGIRGRIIGIVVRWLIKTKK